MKFGYTILYTDDVEKSVAFYEKAFDLVRRFVHESGQYAEMETGTTTLAFAANELAENNIKISFKKNYLEEVPAGIEVVFTTDDVQKAFARATAAGAIMVSEPQIKPWGQEVAYVRDRNGILVEIASAMGT